MKVFEMHGEAGDSGRDVSGAVKTGSHACSIMWLSVRVSSPNDPLLPNVFFEDSK
jgi:hypothetical protein